MSKPLIHTGSAFHKLDTIWKSELSDGLKIGFFRERAKTLMLKDDGSLKLVFIDLGKGVCIQIICAH